MSYRALLTRIRNFENLNIREYNKFFSTTYARCESNKSKANQSVTVVNERQKKELKTTKDETSYKPDLIEVGEIEEVYAASGVPYEHIVNRNVCISQPAKNAMQSGTNNIDNWQISFETRERWENPLMGWCSSGDPMSNMKVEFATLDQAVEHCKKMGWKYFVQKPNVVGPKPRSYGQNFAWNKRTRVTTK